MLSVKLTSRAGSDMKVDYPLDTGGTSKSKNETTCR